MKIWTLSYDDGADPSIFHTEADANGAAVDWAYHQWRTWFGPDQRPTPSSWREAVSLLYEQAGFLDSITLSEFDLSDHPAAVQARGALNNCVDQINLLADLANCDDEDVQSALSDAETALEMLEK